MSHQTQDVCLSELERLNKEIETVRHEVEQEQRRLSYYRIGQTGGRSSQNTSTISTSERGRTNSEKNSHGPPLSTDATKMYFQTGKYVVDNSKPRTDLEYDPLSNFYAGLHPGAQPKVKNGHGAKKARDTEPDRTKPVAFKARPPRSPSPEPHDDLIEDGVLIIDIPSSPDANGGQDEKVLDCSADRSLKEQKWMEFEEVPHTPPPRLTKPNVSKVSSLSTNEYAEGNKGQTIFIENSKCKTSEKGVLSHLSAETEAKKTAESAAISTFPEPLMKRQENPLEVKSRQYETSYAAETTKLLQPYHFSPNNSLFYKAPVASSLCSQQREPPAQDRAAGGCVQGVVADNKAPPPSCLEVAEPGSRCRQSLAADQHSVIVIESNSDDDDDEPTYSELDLSDSDPMEECYRIFMEDNNKDKANELPQTPVSTLLTNTGVLCDASSLFSSIDLFKAAAVTMDVERPEVKVESQDVAGKKRVAHEVRHAGMHD